MKKLVVYYSKTGIVDEMAKLIAKKSHADLYRIHSLKKYDADMWKAWDQAQEEIANNTMPQLDGELPDISQYDQIIIGGPVWGYSISNPIHAYLNKTDFQGKDISVFWTYYDHDEKYVQTLKDSLNDGNYQTGLALSMSIINNPSILERKVNEWIDKLN